MCCHKVCFGHFLSQKRRLATSRFYVLPSVQNLKKLPDSARSDFEVKLLLLFSNLGLEARTEAQVEELAAFLPAIASISHDERQAAKRLLMSSNSMDFETLQHHQKVDAQLVKVRQESLSFW